MYKDKNYHKKYSKEYYLQNKKYFKNYALKNKQKIKKYHKKYYLRNKEYFKNYTLKNKEKAKKYMREYNQKAKMLILTNYGLNKKAKCWFCGENNIDRLTLDHIKGDGKQKRKEGHKLGNWLNHFLIKNNFPKGYRTLCFSCNSELGIVLVPRYRSLQGLTKKQAIEKAEIEIKKRYKN